MRRIDKEISDLQVMEEVLREAQVCRIAMYDEDYPYLIPMNFGYRDGCIYLHSADEGHKIDLLRKNPRVSFEAETKLELRKGSEPCKWGMRYYSVIGQGVVQFLEDDELKREALDILTEKHTGQHKFAYPQEALDKIVVLKLAIEQMTGKKSGY